MRAIHGLGLVLVGCMGVPQPLPAQAESNRAERPRCRDIGIHPGVFRPGPLNAITDVPGVRVGHTTVREEGSLCTGVTAIVPHEGNLFRDKVRAGCFVGNGFGKLVGTTQLLELGTLETPILLTATLSTFRAADALIAILLAQPGNEEVRSINPVVGETNDGYLSDIRRRPIEETHVRHALETASGGSVEEGVVGAGTGTRCLGYKGGVGTASRRLEVSGEEVSLGVLVQSNFGGRLRVLGVPVAEELQRDPRPAPPDKGSCMIVVATDAPLDARQLTRLARRAVFGLGGVGASYSHGSGDYAITFSTELASSNRRVDDQHLSPLFAATLEAVEEAVLNSLLRATDTTGFQGRTVKAIPIAALVKVLQSHGIKAHAPTK